MTSASAADWTSVSERGISHRSAGDTEAATTCFRQAIALAPDEMWPKIHLAVTLRDAGHFDDALHLLIGAVELNPQNSYALRETAETARQHGLHAQAAEYYGKLASIEPDRLEHHLYLADQLRRSGKNLEAVDVLAALMDRPGTRENAVAELSAISRTVASVGPKIDAVLDSYGVSIRRIPVASANKTGKVPLNQVYQVDRTYADHPEVLRRRVAFDNLSTASGQREENGKAIPFGRSYDYAVLSSVGIGFAGKTIADLGARDGYFGAWLTDQADKVHISDYFHLWESEWHAKDRPPEIDSFADWQRRWKEMAPNPDRLVCERQDITKLTYPDEYFDVTVCTSVIEHMWPNDIKGISEMVRVTKLGGALLLSSEMSPANGWFHGTYWYNEASLLARLIEPHPVEFVGPWDFSLQGCEAECIKIGKTTAPVYSCVFALRRV